MALRLFPRFAGDWLRRYRRRDSSSAIYLLGLLAAAIVVGGGIALLIRDYEDTVRKEIAAAERLSHLMEEHARSAVRQAAVILSRAAIIVVNQGGPRAATDISSWRELRDLTDHLFGAASLFVVDSAGKIALSTGVHASGVDVSDRDYFRSHKARDLALFVGPSIGNRATGDIVFTITRRLEDAHGEFLGIVGLSIATSYLTGFSDLLDLADNSLIGVYRLNGEMIARRPEMEKFVGGSIASGPMFARATADPRPWGHYSFASSFDGIERLAWFKRIPELDLLIVTGVAHETAARYLQRKSGRTVGAIAAGLLVVAGATGIAARFSRRERRFLSALHSEREGRRSAERQRDRAHHDPLTGLPGRTLLLDRGMEYAARADRHGRIFSVLFVDLDEFKAVNDTLGHDAGDEVLRAVAALLKSCIREEDVAFRHGGDEFVVCLDPLSTGSTEVAQAIAERIVNEFRSANLKIGASIGIAHYPMHGASFEAVLKAADEAMYAAKRAGKNRFAVFEPAAPAQAAAQAGTTRAR